MTQIIESREQMREISLKHRAEGKRIGFVPTMGFLHDGHLSLVDRAKELVDIVIVSIFVNPTQFGPGEDYDSYPRDLERDADMLRQHGVDYIFYPNANAVNPEDSAITCAPKAARPLSTSRA